MKVLLNKNKHGNVIIEGRKKNNTGSNTFWCPDSLVIEGEEVFIWASEHETKMYALFKVLLLKTEKVSRVRTTLVEQIYNRSTSISGRERQFGATGY